MTLRSLLLTVSACLLVAPLFAGCGGAAAPPAEAVAPGAAQVDDLSTPEGASAAVDRAERKLDQLLGPRQSTTLAQQAGAAPQPFATPPAAPEPPPPPPPPPAPPPAASSAAEASPDHANAKKAPSTPLIAPAPPAVTALDTCSTACSALASMTRAAEHLCSLAGAADVRCSAARTRLHAATARVRASCPTCGG